MGISLQTDGEFERRDVGRIQSEIVRTVEVQRSVLVLEERGVIEVRRDAGIGLDVVLLDLAVVVAAQRRIDVRGLEPELVRDALARDDLDTAVEPLGFGGRSAEK